MKYVIDSLRPIGNHRLEVVYADGLTAVLDFGEFLAEHDGPILAPLRDMNAFSAVHVEHGVASWKTGFDICPDVLRFWCEQGRVCSDRETDRHFEERRPLSAS